MNVSRPELERIAGAETVWMRWSQHGEGLSVRNKCQESVKKGGESLNLHDPDYAGAGRAVVRMSSHQDPSCRDIHEKALWSVADRIRTVSGKAEGSENMGDIFCRPSRRDFTKNISMFTASKIDEVRNIRHVIRISSSINSDSERSGTSLE
jgi:hypothetical protein